MPKSTHLPRTSRVNEKILEYYLKFGQDRDLEKYMRLYSPCGHRSGSRSTTTASSCHSEDEGHVFRQLFHQETDTTPDSESEMKEIIVPIKTQTEKMTEKNIKTKRAECTASAPDVHTPPPPSQKNTNTKQTQTPESVAKSHRRLEWDSLGDVGYRKSLSTSNISILERSVLKEYFQEISSIRSSPKKVDISEDKRDKNIEIVKLINKAAQVKPKETRPVEKSINGNTTPLASSTMMDSKSRKGNVITESLPKLLSKSTSMSIQKKNDQYAQTSVQRMPQFTSQEVQVSMSSAASFTSSNAAGTATPSSFECYSSRSTHSTTDGENSVGKFSLNNKNKIIMKSKDRPTTTPMHPFVAEIHEMIASHKALGNNSKNDNNNIASVQEVHSNLKQVLTENKENSSDKTLNSPQLDLGIQLLCSLIDARSLNQGQKKKLVRDIVKRISTLNIDDNDVNGAEAMAASSEYAVSEDLAINEPHKVFPSKVDTILDSTSMLNVARTAKASIDLGRDQPSSTSSGRGDEKLVHLEVLTKPSPPTTSAKALAKLAAEKTKNTQKHEKKTARSLAGSQIKNGIVPKLNDGQLSANTHSDKDSSASKVSSTSKDVTTQKAVISKQSTGSSDTDNDVAAHSTMREWLNPMTQSEIEYEEKKLEFSRNAAKRNTIMNGLDSDKMDTERRSQLKWIQCEIQRLETLRCLLAKPNMERSTETTADKLYDTVFSEPQRAFVTTSTASPGSALSSGNRAMQEIEVIIEESNEDVIELDEKLKRSKQRKRETQIIYDKPNETANIYGNLLVGKARYRTMTETLTTNEEQVLPILPSDAVLQNIPMPASPSKQLPETKQRQQQRSKIDTPSGDSNDGESVGSFAKQRKREFLEQYRRKKRIHYESLLQQQQQLLIQQQQQIIQELQQRCNAISHTTAGATVETYSVPHTGHNNFCPCVAEQRPYHQTYYPQPGKDMGMTQPRRTNTLPHCPPCPPCAPRAQTYQSNTINYARKTQQQTIHSEQSTSSVFCISSEVSIPMGSSSTNSSTTTHHYDDVAAVGAFTAGVGVQTGNSLRRTQPIFGRRLLCNVNEAKNAPNWAIYDPQPICSGQSISVQVKPKAIAYVIQFDKKTTSSTTTTTTATATTASSTLNSDFVQKPSKEKNTLKDDKFNPCALQDYLERAKPRFVAHTKERKAILNEIQALRQERGRELREIIENASENSLDTRLQHLPPPATKRLRIFATKEMKAMTQRHCKNLPEVVKQQQRIREERLRHGNRLIRDIFNQRLQRRVRTGKLSLNHSKTVI